MKKAVPALAALLFLAAFTFLSCSKDDESTGENQFRANINGKDSVFTISKATLQNFSDHQQLSIITTLSGTAFDMYVNAPQITTGEYPIANPFGGHYPDEYSCCYYRILFPNSVYTSRAFVSTETAAEFKTVITELDGKNVKGTIRFKALDQGWLTSGEVIVDASFSTNLLEIIN